MKATWQTLPQRNVTPLCESIVKIAKCRNRLVDNNNNNDHH